METTPAIKFTFSPLSLISRFPFCSILEPYNKENDIKKENNCKSDCREKVNTKEDAF